MSSPRVIVVGGGVIGISCAYYLAKGGADVVVIEQEQIGAGASFGNAGTISAGHPPLNRPGRVSKALTQMLDPASPLYIHPSWNPGLWRWLMGFARYCTEEHVEKAMQVMAPMGKKTLALFDELIRQERIECEYRVDGYYDVCSTETGLANAIHEAQIISNHGYAPEVLDSDELRRREPELGTRVLGGIYYPESATLDPGLFLKRLAEVTEQRGVSVREGERVRSVLFEAGRATGVKLDTGREERGDEVVLSTGPLSLELAHQVGTRLPVQPGKGYHRDIPIGPNGAPRLQIACVLNETAVFCTPLYTFVRFAGTMEFSGPNLVMRPARLRQLTEAGRLFFPGLGTARPISEWCGLRPMSVDGLPIVGPLPGVDGLTVATGHGMLGLTLAPVTGRMIADQLLEGVRVPEALLPARFN